jgi:hypothetical protein
MPRLRHGGQNPLPIAQTAGLGKGRAGRIARHRPIGRDQARCDQHPRQNRMGLRHGRGQKARRDQLIQCLAQTRVQRGAMGQLQRVDDKLHIDQAAAHQLHIQAPRGALCSAIF